MIALIAAIVFGYLLGSLLGSLLLGQLRGVDIRHAGSGNAGGTNALRTQGWRFALGVVVIDVGKGALAAWGGMRVATLAAAAGVDAYACGAAAAFAAVIGHCWPLFFGFRGGKGAGTAIGAVLVLAPLLALPAVGAWLLVLIATGYVGLSTVIAGAVFAVSAALIAPARAADVAVLNAFAGATALLLVFTHRENLMRLARGTEFRFDKVRLLHRLAKRLRSGSTTLLLLLLTCAASFAVHAHADVPPTDDGIAPAVRLIHTGAAQHRLILLGELHGTREVPRLVAALVRDYAAREPVLLGLEVPASERASLQRYLASDGGADARSRLAHSAFWNAANTDHDGRRNESMLGLIEQVRRLRALGRDVDLLPFDNPHTLQVDSETRDRLMAQRLHTAFTRLRRGRLIALAGNVHAMTARPSYAPPEMQKPMGSYLRDLHPYAVDVTAAAGESWACLAHCGAIALHANHNTSGPADDGAYDLDVVLPRFTVARMLGAAHASDR